MHRWRVIALLLGVPVVVHGAWGYSILDVMQYTIGCLVGVAMIGLWIGRRAHGDHAPSTIRGDQG